MERPFQLIVCLATAFAVLSPLIFIAIRESIKRQRQQIITDLAIVFEINDRSGPMLIPSFEFVKYKYFVGAHRHGDPLVGRSDDEGIGAAERDTRGRREDYSTLSWLIGSAPFSAFVGMAVFYALSLLMSLLASQTSHPDGLRWTGIAYLAPGSDGMVWLLGLCAAFAGSYVTALRNLYRAVKNFDLSPGALVGETIRMLLSVVLVPILVVSLLWIGTALVAPLFGSGSSVGRPTTIAMAVAACFVAGIMPDVVLRNIVQRDKLKNFKREEEEVFQAFKITPVEIIDGIDSEIRVRLDDHHIYSTQNLAAANPLMLFVETPFGVYQIMDWVAQAQLCCSVGRDKVVKLWPFGVRTLFDLERLAGARGARNEALLLEVGRVLLGSAMVSSDANDSAAAAALVRVSIELRLDDPHVQRLRQIYIAVGDRLGPHSRRFRPDRYRYLCRYRFRKGQICRILTPKAA